MNVITLPYISEYPLVHNSPKEIPTISSRKICKIAPRSAVSFRTGVHIDVPAGYYARLYATGNLLKNNIHVSSEPINSGSLSEILVYIHNNSDVEHTIDKGEKLAYIILSPTVDVQLRNASGFSTCHFATAATAAATIAGK